MMICRKTPGETTQSYQGYQYRRLQLLILNDYVDVPSTPSDIDKCHRLQKRPMNPNANCKQKPANIIVKIVAYLTKDPMIKLRSDAI